MISVAPLLLLTCLPFPSPPFLFSLVSLAHPFLFSLVFPFLAPLFACGPLLSFSPLQLWLLLSGVPSPVAAEASPPVLVNSTSAKVMSIFLLK